MKLDPRIMFYLKHQQAIDEWAALRKLTVKKVDEFFFSIFDDLKVKNINFPGNPSFNLEKDRMYPIGRLWRPSWESVDEFKIKNKLKVHISFQWAKRKSSFNMLYGGVESINSCPASIILRTRLHDLASAENFNEDQWWVASRYLEHSRSDYYMNLDTYKEELFREIARIWEMFYPLIDNLAEELKRKR